MNSGKNLKLAGILWNEPKACTSTAMIYHHPYRLQLLSSCQFGQPNGWLKYMCGHPRVKWKLWLWQKMDSCGRAYGLIQCNVIDMLLCFIISPPAPQHICDCSAIHGHLTNVLLSYNTGKHDIFPSSFPCVFCTDVRHFFFKFQFENYSCFSCSREITKSFFLFF